MPDADPATSQRLTPELFFAGHPLADAAYRVIRRALEQLGAVDVRTTRSQVAFRRRRGFAYLWLPPAWTRPRPAELVLSIALERLDASPRFKQVAHPAARVWMHHLELHAPADVDAEVIAWLGEAYDTAA